MPKGKSSDEFLFVTRQMQQRQQEFEAKFEAKFLEGLDRYHNDAKFKNQVWLLHEAAALARLKFPEVFGQTRVQSHVDTDIPEMIAAMVAIEMDLLTAPDNI